MVPTYHPPDQNQPDSISCVPTSTSDAIDQATAGRRHPSVYSLRKAENDFSGGMDYIQMTGATMAVAGVKAEAKFGVDVLDFRGLDGAGKPMVCSIDTAVTHPYAEVRTGGFIGGHSVFKPAKAFSIWPAGDTCGCEKRSASRHGEYSIADPGTYSKGYIQISAELFHRAMLTRADNGGVNVLVLPDVYHVKRRVALAGYIRSRPDTTTASRKLRRAAVGQTLSLARPVAGSRWRRPDGTWSTGWWELEDGTFIRADKLGVTNV